MRQTPNRGCRVFKRQRRGTFVVKSICRKKFLKNFELSGLRYKKNTLPRWLNVRESSSWTLGCTRRNRTMVVKCKKIGVPLVLNVPSPRQLLGAPELSTLCLQQKGVFDQGGRVVSLQGGLHGKDGEFQTPWSFCCNNISMQLWRPNASIEEVMGVIKWPR